MNLAPSLTAKFKPKNIARKFASCLPIKLRHMLLRSLVRLPQEVPNGLSCELAHTKEDLESAYRLLHDAYVQLGFAKPDPSGMRVTVYHALPSTATLVAKIDGRVVGTISIIRDNAFGLPLDNIFEVEPLRKYGARVAEISSLAVDPSYRESGGVVMYTLMAYMFRYCMNYFGVDTMVIAVNPRHIEFYEAVLGFERLTEKVVDSYDFANGNPAVGAYLGVRSACQKWSALYGAQSPERNLSNFFIDRPMLGFQYPHRRYFKIVDPVLTPELLDYFFNRKTQTFAQLSGRERSIINALYNHDKYKHVLPLPPSDISYLHGRRSSRFDVKCTGRVILSSSRIVKLTVRNASSTGIQAHLEEPIRFGAPVRINIAVAEIEIADLLGWPVWKDNASIYGFHIDSSCKQWESFIEYLHGDMTQDAKIVQFRSLPLQTNKIA